MRIPKLKAVILPHHIKEDGSVYAKIRLTHGRKVKYLATTEKVKKGEYDKKSFLITSNSINKRLLDLIDEMETIIKSKNSFYVSSLDVGELADLITSEMAKKEGFHLDFFEFGRKVASRKSRYSAFNYRSALSSLAMFISSGDLGAAQTRAFVKSGTYDITLITSSFMRKYEAFLIEKHGRDARAVSLYTSSIAAIHSEARKLYNDNETGEVLIKNPFLFYTPPKQKPAQKRTLTKGVIQKLIDIRHTLEGNQRFAVDMFLISFSLMGTNIPDLYAAVNIDDDTITYNRTKTKDRRYDKAEMQIRREPAVRKLHDEYADPKKEMAFNLSRKYKGYRSVGRKCNIELKEVAKLIGEKEFSMYTARHTWATIAYEISIPMEIINDCLCHVDLKMAVTDIYIKKDWSKRWDANKKVLDQFDWSKL